MKAHLKHIIAAIVAAAMSPLSAGCIDPPHTMASCFSATEGVKKYLVNDGGNYIIYECLSNEIVLECGGTQFDMDRKFGQYCPGYRPSGGGGSGAGGGGTATCNGKFNWEDAFACDGYQAN